MKFPADEDDIDEDVGQDAEPEPVSLASMLNAGDDDYDYEEAY